MLAVLDAALDAAVAMDGSGIVRYWNRAAERIFGWTAAQASGREMAELIVPERHREAHRRGVERLVGGGVPVLIDQRVEIHAQDASGREFPVELTVTRMPLGGAAVRRLRARHLRPRRRPSRRCASPATGCSRPPTRPAAASSATSTTAHSSG